MASLESHAKEDADLAARLRAKQGAILSEWEASARRIIPITRNVDRLILLDSLPAFLENLAAALERRDQLKALGFENESSSHARQRAELTGYKLDHVITEYRLLTRAIFNKLEQSEPLSTERREKLLSLIKFAVDDVTDSFIKSTEERYEECETLSASSVRRYRMATRLTAVLIMLISGLTMLGWMIGIGKVYPLFGSMAIMAPSTSFCMLLMGVTLWLLASDLQSKSSRTASLVIIGIYVGISILKMVQISNHGTPWELKFFQLNSMYDYFHVQMTFSSALEFVLLGSALAFYTVRHRGMVTLSQSLSLVAAMISSGYLVSHIYGILSNEMGFASSMGMHSAIGMFLASIGVLVARPDQGLMAIVTSESPGGYIARRMIPATIVIPVTFGWIRILGQAHGLFGTLVGVTLLVISLLAIFTALIWYLAWQINILARERRRFKKETVGALTRHDEMLSTLEELKREREVRERFVSALTHDLRNPLTTIKASADLGLRFPERSKDHAQLFQRISDSSRRAEKMIRDLLDVNRIRAGQPLPIQIEECDLKFVVERALEELEFTLGKRFVFEYSKHLRGYWSTDALIRIVENLCTNAVKYGDEKSKVTVRVRERRDEVELSVHNYGKPLSKDEQRRIFDPFRRTESADQSRKSGWGLGLALVRGLAEAQGGTIEVRSTAKEGTVFTVRLPRDARLYHTESA
jgi:signal transduction histidine kinase